MSKKPGKARGLGRGLSALMAELPEDDAQTPTRSDTTLPIDQIAPNPDQPRRRFDQEALDDLAASISERGIIQPIIVRPYGDGYQIVAGERRWRAAQIAQLHEVPVVIRELGDTETLELAIIENIQRSDLNAIDEGAGYKQLVDRFGHTQEELSKILGKSRSHIANLMRLLTLPDDIQALVARGDLSAGHARALITADDPSALARRVIRDGLSVRATETLANASKPDRKPVQKVQTKDADTRQIEKELSAQLKMPVQIQPGKNPEQGKVTLNYKNLDQLDDLLRLLSQT
ncbi:ParB/RepB/Spo0J family partition protein [Aestuariibius sp. 2305UL40-4]|uniref:ParB/RepB/Spo0J family partition protein n=1 Tax=Aestuariibius violaceus TaxID=3234132 RepID=UPI00345EC1D4